MIDGIKFVTYDFDIESLINDEKLDFAPEVAPLSYESVVIGYKAKLKDTLYVKIMIEYLFNGKYSKLTRPKLTVEGSLHKFQHGCNDTDFTLSDVSSTIENLCHLLKIEPTKCYIHTIEFGVNIPLSIAPSQVFDLYLMYAQKMFVSFNDIDANARFNGVRCSLSQFAIKVYDKGREYLRSDNLMRFECKVEKMQFLEKRGVFIKTLQDLNKVETFNKLSKILLELDEDILKINNCDIAKMSPREKNLFKDGKNFKFWSELKKGTNKNTTKVNIKRKMKKFKSINELYKNDNRHGDTLKLLEQKCNDLMQKSVPFFTDFKTPHEKENVPLFTLRIKVNKGTFLLLPIHI